jgi:hypothetical protein
MTEMATPPFVKFGRPVQQQLQELKSGVVAIMGYRSEVHNPSTMAKLAGILMVILILTSGERSRSRKILGQVYFIRR